MGGTDYFKSEKEFEARMEADATSFKPMGKKFHSYARSNGKGKGKGKANAMAVDEQDEDAIVYEVYWVGSCMQHNLSSPSLSSSDASSVTGARLDSRSIIEGCNSLFCFTSKEAHTFKKTKTDGNLLYCMSPFGSFVKSNPVNTKSLLALSGGEEPMGHSLTISLATLHCINSSTGQTRYAYG